MAIDRRTFLTASAAGLFTVTSGTWAKAPGERYLGVRFHRATRQFVAVVADRSGQSLKEVPLPGRGHGVVASPGDREAVAIARRPGDFAVVFSLDNVMTPYTFHTSPDRHFQGHAVFDAAGRYLLTTENDFEGERGVIGIYDAKDTFRRVGEIPSHGIGAHELAMMPDGKTLVVANGGILTHPDTGRAKLNVPTMAPSLVYVDVASGKLMDRWEPPQGRQSKLSIRHLTVLHDGRVSFACQDQGSLEDALPLAGLHRPGSGDVLPLQAPKEVHRSMAGYCGSVAVDTSGRTIAVSAPRGNRVVFWDADSRALIGVSQLSDGCGVAAAGEADQFVLSSGEGVFTLREAERNSGLPSPMGDGMPWDNHLSRV